MTEEEFNNLMRVYGLLQSVPGKTASQRVNLLQDIGFDFFGQPQQFVEEQFVGEPEPELVNPVAAAYGKKGSPWVSVFAAIESGADPDQAVEDAIKAGTLKKRGYGDDRSNPFEIAREYATKEAENEARYNEWRSRNQSEFAKFGEKQNRLRSQFEADRPLSFQDFSGSTQYEQMGAPSVDDLVRTVRLREGLDKSGQPGVMPNSLWKNPKYEKALRRKLEERVGQAKQTAVPTDRSQAAMRNLFMMQALG